MGLLTEVQTELQSLISQAWPDIVMPGSGTPKTFWTEVQAFQNNFVEMAARALEGNNALPVPPYAILQFGNERNDPDWGISNHGNRFPITVYRIERQGVKSQVQLRDEMASLRALIDDPEAEFDTFQAIERGEIDTSADSPLNSALLVDAQTGFICSNLRYDPGILVMED